MLDCSPVYELCLPCNQSDQNQIFDPLCHVIKSCEAQKASKNS